MCDVCSNDSKWTTPPNTNARQKEVQDRLEQDVLDDGHRVMCIAGTDKEPGFFYSVGRSLLGKPELLVTGNLPERAGVSIVNTLADEEDRRNINTLAAANDQPIEVGPFLAPLRLRRIDPHVGSLFAAIEMGGANIIAIQIIWPDDHGQWPDSEGGWHYGDGSEQPVFPMFPVAP